MLGRPSNILTALLRRRDKFATRSTWLAQKALRGVASLYWIPLSSGRLVVIPYWFSGTFAVHSFNEATMQCDIMESLWSHPQQNLSRGK